MLRVLLIVQLFVGHYTRVAGLVEQPVVIHFGEITQAALAVALTQGDSAVYQIAVIVQASLAPGDYSVGVEINGSVTTTGTLTVGAAE